jgi:hypothetical protein
MNAQAKDIHDDVTDKTDASEAQEGEVEEDDDDFEIEIVDDVPEDEKPRRAEGEKPDLPDDDDLESYSESVQKRIKKLKFEYHEAERQKQEAARLREEAINYAKQIQAENERLRQSLQKNEGSLVEQAKARVESELNSAKAAYRAAYEAGDSDAVLEAQSKLTQLQNDMYRLQNYRPQQPQQPQRAQPEAQTQAQPQVPQRAEDVKLSEAQKAWLAKNDWWGKDRRMTSFALGVHEELVHSGVVPDSERYYTEIDKELRKVFPDKFSDAADQEEVSPRQKKAANVVAPAPRSAKQPRKVKLTSTQAAIAKRLGVTPEQYAAQLMKDARNG